MKHYIAAAAILFLGMQVGCVEPPVPGTDINLAITLTGGASVPPVNTAGSGSGQLTVNDGNGSISGELSVSGFTATAAHIHSAYAGNNGAAIVTLEQDATDTTLFRVPAKSVLTPADLKSLLNGGLYLNAHSAVFPNGEVRGQILPSGVTVYRTQLVSAAPKNKAKGTGVITVNANNANVAGNITVSTMIPTAAHIHSGAAGTTGPVVATFVQDSVNANFFKLPDTTFSDTVFAALTSAGTYLNVHSSTFPDGEIRGQIQ